MSSPVSPVTTVVTRACHANRQSRASKNVQYASNDDLIHLCTLKTSLERAGRRRNENSASWTYWRTMPRYEPARRHALNRR
jgi:hypothetical protein